VFHAVTLRAAGVVLKVFADGPISPCGSFAR
jgi:hypothetical protein